MQAMRLAIRDAKHVATCAEFGPRFLHSTGQAYKGGPDSGVFLQITADDADDLPVPGQKASFGIIKAAQARGDFGVLTERGRRALRVHLKGDVGAGFEEARRRDRATRCVKESSSCRLGMIGLGRMGGEHRAPPDERTATRRRLRQGSEGRRGPARRRRRRRGQSRRSGRQSSTRRAPSG